MRKIIASAPGKAILFGEHSVVWGYPAIVMAISKRSLCHIEESQDNSINIVLKNYNLDFKAMDYQYFLDNFPYQFSQIKTCFQILNKKYKVDFTGVNLEVSSELIPGSGLGASASVAVAVTAALDQYYCLGLKKAEISQIAFSMEKIPHGNPSGIDNNICTYGGVMMFQKGDFHFIDVPDDFSILIAYSNIKHQTKKAISRIEKLKVENSLLFEEICEKIGLQTQIAESELLNGNLPEIGNLMNVNQRLLEQLDLSNSNISEIIKIARENGAYGSKITGAGLGGCVIALCERENLMKIADILNKNGYNSFISNIERKGVIIEKSE